MRTSTTQESKLALPATSSPPLDKRDWIAGLENGLGLIEVFDDANPRLTASQAGALCGLTRTAARRYLLTLQHLGYIASDGKLFWLTPRILRLGQSYLESARLPRIAQPFLQRVTAGTQESAYISVMDGEEIVYIGRNGANRNMNTGYILGSRVPAQVTAAGILMMALRPQTWVDDWLAMRDLRTYTPHTIISKEHMRATMDSIRSQGWVLSEQQLELGFRGVAVPVRDRNGTVVAALSVTMPMGNEPGEDAVAWVLSVLADAAQSMRNLI